MAFDVALGETLVLSDGSRGTRVSLVPARGAIVTSFRVGERELLYLDETTLRDPAKNVRGGIPILFPSPGKLEGDRYTRGAVEGAMKQHGFARNLPWEVVDTRTTGAASATLALVSNAATRAMFPWDFRLTIAFSLVGLRLRLDVRVENTGAAAMPFAFGIHPYFIVPNKKDASISTRATRAFDNVKKEVVAFPGTFDLTADEVDLHLLDHGSDRSTLAWPTGRVTLSASPEHVRWVVWTLRGKDYVCVEPWTAPGNALNTGESLLYVEPGRARELWVAIEGEGAA
jgi:galactose mutarotase-like enzyme